MATNGRTAYSGGRFTLELDQKKAVGFVASIDGGHFKAEGVPSQVGADMVTTRYPGRPKFEDITITCGMAMSPSFWKWVQATLDGKPERRSGALVGYDFNSKERSRRTFREALISEVGFPALDGGSKSSALMTIKISPEQVEYATGDGSTLQYSQSQDEQAKQKRWLVSNFTFALDSKIVGEMRSVKIDAFTVKQNVISNPVGSDRITRKEPGRVEMPSLQLSILESQLADWWKWYDQAVVKGNPEDVTGHITYFASDGQGASRTELMRLDLSGVGLTSLEIDKYEAHKEGIARAKAVLYVEGITLKPGQGTA